MLRLMSDLLAATADAHSPRALVRAVAVTLARYLPVTRVELLGAIAELVDGRWRIVESGPRCPHEIAPGLAVTGEVELDADAREALGHVIAAAARHLDVVQRVAKLSRRAHAENRELRQRLERNIVVAHSVAMRSALTRVQLVARHPTAVLLLGESGSGKEVLAREIHRLSPRAHRELVHVNCGAIPESLVESELFGHERGAFTGADRAHAGVFERAHGGTLFLDEVGELPPAAQVKLLRVLQERQVQRVGGEAPIDVDFRLIAATNRSLDEMVFAGTFRRDLFYRLSILTIRVPPLRERRSDLAPLVAHLVGELSEKLGVPAPTITPDVIARLEAHDWPGNVRELANVLETAMVLGEGTLELPDFTTPRSGGLDAAMRETIESTLRATRGKIYGRGGAAERLGLPPATLQSKMKKLGIARATFA